MCRLHQCPISYWVHCPVIWYLLIQPVKKYNYVQITSMSHFILSTLSCNLVPLNTACQKNTIMCRLHQCPISYWVHCPVIWYLLIQPVKKYNYVQITSMSISYWVHCPVIWYLLIQPVNKIQLCADFILSTLSCNLVPLNTACQKIQLCADYINVPFHTEYTVL